MVITAANGHKSNGNGKKHSGSKVRIPKGRQRRRKTTDRNHPHNADDQKEVRSKALVLLLWGMVGLGAFSVWVWALTDDLRLYGLVQFGSMAAAFILLIWKREKIHGTNMLWATLFFYAAAKVAETFDRQIFDVTALYCSGHTLKHLLASVATWISIRFLIASSKHHLNIEK
jgi:hypothetical protein